MTIIGMREVNFTNNEGNLITGFRVWFTETDAHVEGFKADSAFISFATSNRNNYTPHVGDEIEIYYDKNGRIKSIQRIEE